MTARKLAILCSVSAMVLITACSSNPPRNNSIATAPAAASTASQFGNVSSIDVVPMTSRSIGAGAVLGGVLGAVIGNQVGHGTGRAAATGLGAVGGAVIGNSLENRNKSESDIYRVSVRYDNGSVGQFDYQRIDDLRVGDRVKVEGGQLHRV